MRGSGVAMDPDLSPKRILDDLDGHATLGALMQLRSQRGSWWSVATELGNLLEQVGEDWQAGTLSVVQEHVISERLLRSLHSVCQSIPLSYSAPICLLVMASGDEHTLGLRLAELTAREAGWQSLWVGSKTPLRELALALEVPLVQALAVSASRYCANAENLAAEAEALAAIATSAKLPLALGGQGGWPEAPRYGSRVNSFLDFREFLHQSAAFWPSSQRIDP